MFEEEVRRRESEGKRLVSSSTKSVRASAYQPELAKRVACRDSLEVRIQRLRIPVADVLYLLKRNGEVYPL